MQLNTRKKMIFIQIRDYSLDLTAFTKFDNFDKDKKG